MKARTRIPRDVAETLVYCEAWTWGKAATMATAVLNKYGIARSRGRLIDTVVEFAPAESAAGAKPAPAGCVTSSADDAEGCPSISVAGSTAVACDCARLGYECPHGGAA